MLTITGIAMDLQTRKELSKLYYQNGENVTILNYLNQVYGVSYINFVCSSTNFNWILRKYYVDRWSSIPARCRKQTELHSEGIREASTSFTDSPRQSRRMGFSEELKLTPTSMKGLLQVTAALKCYSHIQCVSIY